MIEKVTNFSSITLVLLKELRLERSIHQAQIADMCDRTPSAWTKIETGKSPLPMEMFFRVCNGIQVPPSAVLAAMERYAALLSQNGWAVISKQLEFNEDKLLIEAQEYYSSNGFKARHTMAPLPYSSVLNSPIYNIDGSVAPIPVFAFALFEEAKNNLINWSLQPTEIMY